MTELAMHLVLTQGDEGSNPSGRTSSLKKWE
jgi:hypothetical protein